MKKIILLFLLMSQVHAYDYVMKVRGMVCSFCAQGIVKQLDSLGGVSNIDVNMDNMTISFKSENEVVKSKAYQLVQDAGYKLVDFQEKESKK